MAKLELVDASRAEELKKQVMTWVKAHGGFSSYQNVSAYAVAEFLANQEGKTLFDYKVGEDCPFETR